MTALERNWEGGKEGRSPGPTQHSALGGGLAGVGAQAAGRDWGRLAFLMLRVGAWIN